MTAIATSVNMRQLENSRDGNCLFQSFSYLVYGFAANHCQVRAETVALSGGFPVGWPSTNIC